MSAKDKKGPLPIFVWVFDFQNGRFGNQNLQGELGERKLISPERKVC